MREIPADIMAELKGIVTGNDEHNGWPVEEWRTYLGMDDQSTRKVRHDLDLAVEAGRMVKCRGTFDGKRNRMLYRLADAEKWNRIKARVEDNG